jgi:ABC-type phosphate transport system substrate-binding protein
MPHLLSRTQTGKPPRIPAVLTACTSASSTSSTLQASAAGSSTVRLTGVGSTFDAPFFTKAFAVYQRTRQGRPSGAQHRAAARRRDL